MTEFLSAPSPLELRREFVEMVYNDLHGPAGGDNEIVTEPSVRGRYVLGLLAPNNHSPLPDPADEMGAVATDGDDKGEDGRAEPPVPEVGASTGFMPSSMGLSFSLASDVETVTVRVRWGSYQRAFDDKHTAYWQRQQNDYMTTLALTDDLYWTPDAMNPHVYVRGVVRQRAGGYAVTLFLVNGMTEPKERKDEAWLFQPEIILTSREGQADFIKRPVKMASALDDVVDIEDLTMAMMYRQTVEFAVGHGVSVQAESYPHDGARAHTLHTQVVPMYEVERMDPPPMPDLVIDMKVLSETGMGHFGDVLLPLVEQYGAWLRGQQAQVDNPTADLQPFIESGATKATLNHAKATLARIQEGIALIDDDPQAALAFQFANRAMYLQRVRSIYAEHNRQGNNPNMDDIDVPKNRSWRPFQLAFLLLNLPEMVNPTHERRSHPEQAFADLLWFPTGGGKTEAYLGLAAFALGIRRLQGEVGGVSGHAGVTVLMRYTLRLLTLQQFQRATTLITACEMIRRDDPTTWGDEPFRIGLWVGQSSTPNWTDDAAEAIKRDHGKWSGGKVGSVGTPVQLTHCPWCGAPIDAGKHIRVETYKDGRGRTFTYCGDMLGQCPFSQRQSPDEGLPVVVVDEEIYRRLPALLIATVDKFAQMPWKGATQMLFGRVNGYCPRHGWRSPEIEDADRHPAKGNLPACKTQTVMPLRPPDLIIQDELHLISGPLGTLVGLYETAVDALCSWELDGHTVRPKVVASTATVRRARQQVYHLFLRQVKIFPPSGLDAEDNFFSKRAPSSDSAPGRLYLGICASGTRQKAVLIRVYVAAMAAAQVLFEKYGDVADPYMTLVGYFNAMRDLGGMRRVVDDAVQTRLLQMNKRGLATRRIHPNSVDELTSRKGAADIPQILDRLEQSFTTDPKGSQGKYPLDVALATNMISVGVDVSRLGMMVVAGQPKATAEYIQATSRVGRRHPGVVFTVYNWARPRDMSHYERFGHYHATFYQQVEALSVTPFAMRALDRGLSGVMVALIRLFNERYNPNEGAAQFDVNDDAVQFAYDTLRHRAETVTEDTRVTYEIDAMLKKRFDVWASMARRASTTLSYQKNRKSDVSISLLKHPNEEDWSTYTLLNSLRDVENGIHLILNDYRMDGEQPLERDSDD